MCSWWCAPPTTTASRTRSAKAMPNGPARQAIIDRMIAILQHDAPWIWGFYEKVYVLQHGWLYNRKPGKIIRSSLKYQRIDVALREERRKEWNKPVVWPVLLAGGLGLLVAPAVLAYRRRERASARLKEV